jgi:cationic peptide transport system substrate-binding protein
MTSIHKWHRAQLHLIWLLLAVFALAGCSENKQIERIKQDGFIYCGQGSPRYFNPQLVDNDIATEALSPQLFDPLLRFDSEKLEPSPHLASSWSVSEDGREYTFVLREGVEFHQTPWFTPTRPMNAHDVVFSFKRIIDSQHAFHYVNSASYPWFAAINFSNTLQDVVALSDYEVLFRLNRADNTFLSNLSTVYPVIHSAEYGNQLAASDEKHLIDTHPIGTGSFKLKEFKHHDYIRLTRHESYWKNQAKMKQVVFDVSSRGTGSLSKLLSNQCDVLYSPVMSQIPVIRDHKDLTLIDVPAMNISFIALQTSSPKLNHPDIRKALSLAINRENIIDTVYFGNGEAAYSLLPSRSWASNRDPFAVRYDPNYARGLLEEQLTNKQPLNLTLWVPASELSYHPSPRKVAELVQSDFADIGVTVSIVFEDRVQRNHRHSTQQYDMVLSSWNADTPDPDNFFRPLLSCDANRAGLNVSTWCNSDFDFLLDLAKETTEARYRKNLYYQAQVIVNDEVPLIPLAHGVQFQAKHYSIEGLAVSPFNTQSFENVYREY